MVGLLEIPPDFFPTLSGIALHNVCIFWLICAEYALRLFNVFDEISEARLKRFRNDMGTKGLTTVLVQG